MHKLLGERLENLGLLNAKMLFLGVLYYGEEFGKAFPNGEKIWRLKSGFMVLKYYNLQVTWWMLK